ncbi:MAG: ABC transporter substrate-binding protein [Candidatus Omnitrophota bacterium]|nr:ABC transporter substrate-binding protein [Candidatus Omnitrophota bacterium]
MKNKIFIRLRRKPRACPCLPAEASAQAGMNATKCASADVTKWASPKADNPPKPWRRWVYLGTTGLPVGCSIFLLLSLTVLFISAKSFAKENTIRIGYFPNITHSQAVVGVAKGVFQKHLGDKVKIEVKMFNAGPSVIEALFAGELDLAYIGPNPAINGYIKSQGEALCIIAGATSGGAGLVVRKDSGINKIRDFHGKKIASPQLGNTQDVALRAWLKNNGFILKEKGGDTQVIPLANPDQLTLFLKKEIDGAWTVEPWVSRLIQQGDGRLFLDESSLWPNGEFVTANIIVNKKFLKEHRDLVKKFIAAHIEMTQWINDNLEESKKIINSELKRIIGKSLPPQVIDQAFSRLKVTYDPIKTSLLTSAKWAFEQGFLGKTFPDLSGIYDLSILNEILSEKGLEPING